MVSFGGRWGRRGGGFHAVGLRGFCVERGDYLRLGVIGKLEIFFLKIGDYLPFGVADHHADQDKIYADTECRRGVAGRDFRSVICGSWRGGEWVRRGIGGGGRAFSTCGGVRAGGGVRG